MKTHHTTLAYHQCLQ